MKDVLGDRMKNYYENRTRILLPRRTYTVIRIDGKAFHTYTRGLKRPFDIGLVQDMDETACYLCKNIQGAKFAFVQSDEISVLMTDFDAIGTDAWFDGNIQKIVSVAASMATSKFNQLRLIRKFNNLNDVDVIAHGETAYNMAISQMLNEKQAEFDARTYTIPCKSEVANYFIWRQQDTVRNSISSVAQSLYSHNELEGKNMSVQQEMIFQKGTNWNDFESKFKRGRFIEKQLVEKTTDKLSPYIKDATFIRSVWVSTECPTFTKETDFLLSRILDNV